MAEEALKTSHAFRRAIIDSLSPHVCVLDKGGVILKTNDAWKEFDPTADGWGVHLGEVGQDYLDLCRRHHRRRHVDRPGPFSRVLKPCWRGAIPYLVSSITCS